MDLLKVLIILVILAFVPTVIRILRRSISKERTKQ